MFIEDFQIPNKKDYSLSFLKYTSDLIISEDWVSSKDLYANIFNKGKKITKKFGGRTPLIFVILKVLKIIRVECARVLSGNPELEEQATNLLFAEAETEVKEVVREDLQEFLSEAVQELIVEMKEADNSITESASHHVRNGDTILTYGYSELVFTVLQHAATKKCDFRVIVLEGTPLRGAALMADKMSKLGVPVVLAPERSSFTLLAGVTNVMVDCDTAFADGGLLCTSGLHRICLDAKAHSVPVLVCMSSCRLSPLLAVTCLDRKLKDQVGDAVYTTYRHDVVPAALVGTLVTNIGSLHPSQLMSIARDCFCADDVRDFLAIV